jgi:hypothetical protein
MTATLLWALLGLVFAGLIVVVTLKTQPAALGPQATRLLVTGVALAAYFGVLPLAHHVPALSNPVRLRIIAWAVPIAGGLAVLYFTWRVLQNWRSELHGLVRGVLELLLIVALAVLARLCFTL